MMMMMIMMQRNEGTLCKMSIDTPPYWIGFHMLSAKIGLTVISTPPQKKKKKERAELCGMYIAVELHYFCVVQDSV